MANCTRCFKKYPRLKIGDVGFCASCNMLLRRNGITKPLLKIIKATRSTCLEHKRCGGGVLQNDLVGYWCADCGKVLKVK